MATQGGLTNSPFVQAISVVGSAGGGGTIALTRTFNNPTAVNTNTLSSAFWSVGQPFPAGAVPTGTTITATLGGTAVPVDCAERKFAANGDLEWCHLLVDFTGISLAGSGGTSLLQLTSATGTWCDAQGNNTCPSGFTKTAWDGLGDAVTLSNVSIGPPQWPGVVCQDAGSGFANNTRVYVVTSYTTAAGETLPSIPSVVDVVNNQGFLTSRCLFSGTTGTVTVSPPPSLFNPGFGLTGWKVYACSTSSTGNSGCSNFQLQSTQTGFGSSFTFSSIASGAAPLTVPTAGAVASSIAGSGTWKAIFDGGVTNHGDNGAETVIADTPQGRLSYVSSNLFDTTSIAATATGTSTLTVTATQTLVGNDAVVLNNSGGTHLGICNAIPTTGLSGSGFQCTNVSSVTAANVASISVINRNIRVVMYYWATCKVPSSSSTVCTTAGPVQSWGPFIENILLHPKSGGPFYGNSSVQSYTFDPEYDRGATKVRGNASTCGGASPVNAYCGATIFALQIHPLVRVDGQGDWTASDPGIYVTDDYGNVIDTHRLPPYKKSISYNANSGGGTPIYNFVSVSSYSSPLFTTAANIVNGWANPVDFPNIGSLSGITACTSATSCPIYWAVPANGTGGGTFCLYDSQFHAIQSGVGGGHGPPSSCSGTGLITPTGTAGAATVEASAAPGATGHYDRSTQDTGGRPDLALAAEWSVAYVVGGSTNNTHGAAQVQAWERVARTQAYAWSTMVNFGVDANTDHIPCFIDQHGGAPGSGDTGCPGTSITAPLGIGFPTDQWGNSFSNDLNGGSASFTGSYGPWISGVPDPQHYGNSVYLVWLMTGDPYLRDMSILMGNGDIANWGLNSRNLQASASASKWFGVTMIGQGGLRALAWITRDVYYAAMAAPQGSPEEAYFRTSLSNDAAFAADYQGIKPANFAQMPALTFDETFGPTNISPPTNTIFESNVGQVFELGYMNSSMALAALLEGDYVPGLITQATKAAQWLKYIFGTINCPYYALMANFNAGMSPSTDAIPGSYISTFADMGLQAGNGAYVKFTPSSSTLTYFDTANTPPGPAFPWTLAAGDTVRFYNYDPNFNELSDIYGGVMGPPSGGTGGAFVMGQDYFVVGTPNQTTLTFQLSATSGGSPITVAYPAWPGASQTVQWRGQPIFPTSNNTGNNYFQPFINHPGITGTTQPNWDASCTASGVGSQCTDGTVTWQNLGTTVQKTAAVFMPTGQGSCPPGFPVGSSSTGTGPGGYLQNLNTGMVIDAKLGISGMLTAANNGLAVFTGDCSQAMFWCMAP